MTYEKKIWKKCSGNLGTWVYQIRTDLVAEEDYRPSMENMSFCIIQHKDHLLPHSPCCMNPQIELFLSLGYILFCHVPSAIFFSEGSEHSMEPSPLRILQTRPIMVICRISWGFSSNSRRIWRKAPAFALSSTYKSIILHQTDSRVQSLRLSI